MNSTAGWASISGSGSGSSACQMGTPERNRNAQTLEAGTVAGMQTVNKMIHIYIYMLLPEFLSFNPSVAVSKLRTQRPRCSMSCYVCVCIYIYIHNSIHNMYMQNILHKSLYDFICLHLGPF